MARKAKPWWWKQRKAWYVIHNGEKVRLHEDKKEAERLFHEMLARPEPVTEPESVWAVFEDFLDACQAETALRTYEWYRDRLQLFKDAVPNMRVDALTPFIVKKWLNQKKGWSDGHKRGIIIALMRAFNWAVKMRRIASNPIRGLDKPRAGIRQQILSQEEFDTILALVPDEHFRDVLEVVWQTGCRPQEITKVEAQHVEDGIWHFPREESKGKRRDRLVFLTDRAYELTRKWVERNPEGPIFRNVKGKPWTAMAFNNRFSQIQLAIAKSRGLTVREEDVECELDRIRARRKRQAKAPRRSEKDLLWEARQSALLKAARKAAPKVCMYALRHSYGHHGLTKARTDPMILATLMGHVSTKMLMERYGHLLQNPEFMRQAAQKTRGGIPAPPEPT